MYGQLINLLNKEDILKFSREYNGERYVKRFDAYQHMAHNALRCHQKIRHIARDY